MSQSAANSSRKRPFQVRNVGAPNSSGSGGDVGSLSQSQELFSTEDIENYQTARGQLSLISELFDGLSDTDSDDDSSFVSGTEGSRSDDSDGSLLDPEQNMVIPSPAFFSVQVVPSNNSSLPSIPTPTPPSQLGWNWSDAKNEVILKEPFATAGGWKCQLTPTMTELDFWKLCFTPDFLKRVVDESNLYAENDIGAADPESISKRKRYFKPITDEDLLRFLAIRMIMGINKKPEYANYWSKDPIFHSFVVPKIMSIDRFLQIQKYLHFCDNQAAATPEDKIFKIRELWEMVTANMESLIVPGESLAVDESLTKFRGRLSFRQFIPTKRNRFGIKTFSLVDAETRFVVKSIIYAGKVENIQFKRCKEAYGYGGAIILELCESLLDQGRTVYCDNYFTSPNLAEKLAGRKTYLCGTLRAGRKNSPAVPKMKKGTCAAFVANRNGTPILVEYWRDKRIVRMISTGISHEMVETTSKSGILRCKPQSIDHYNSNARGIDLADMAISEYDTARKTLKWYMKLFFRLFDLTIYNAFVMMRSQRGPMSFLEFRVNMIKQILDLTGGVKYNARTPAVCGRLNAPHYPTKFPHPRRCKVCSVKAKGKNVRSMYGCAECNVGLCTYPCFGIYHKIENF